MPDFFIKVVENLIWISCAVLVDDHCIVEPVAFLPCFCLKYDRVRFYTPVARAFACLKYCLTELQKRYKQLSDQQSQLTNDENKQFPAIKSCEKFEFKYNDEIEK